MWWPLGDPKIPSKTLEGYVSRIQPSPGWAGRDQLYGKTCALGRQVEKTPHGKTRNAGRQEQREVRGIDVAGGSDELPLWQYHAKTTTRLTFYCSEFPVRDPSH